MVGIIVIIFKNNGNINQTNVIIKQKIVIMK